MMKGSESDMSKTIMDDLIVLGNAVPDEISHNRKAVCTVCYSPEYGLVRIYPAPPSSPLNNRWNIVSIPLERPPQDARQESWKIQGSKDEWPRLAKKIEKVDELSRRDRRSFPTKLYERYGAGCIKDLNAEKVSLGIIKPTILKGYMQDREDVDDTVQLTLDKAIAFNTIKNYEKRPHVQYRCEHCQAAKPHDQQILEWGVYEYMRRYSSHPEQCLDALSLMDAEYEKHFLVGNMAKHRNSFMVVSVFRFKTSS